MGEYQQSVDYFKSLAVQHGAIGHVDGEKEKFFRVNIEEFLSGSLRKLPKPALGPALVLINFIKDLKAAPTLTLNTKQIMFYVIQGYPQDDFNAENQARSACEDVVEDIILRMRHDSLEGHEFFRSSFDRIDKVRIVPVEVRTPAGKFVGWQVSFYLDLPFEKCYDPLKWATV